MNLQKSIITMATRNVVITRVPGYGWAVCTAGLRRYTCRSYREALRMRSAYRLQTAAALSGVHAAIDLAEWHAVRVRQCGQRWPSALSGLLREIRESASEVYASEVVGELS